MGRLELDYDYEDCNIIPSADPEASSKNIERQKAEILLNLIQLGLPRGIVLKRFMEAMDIPHIEEFNLDALNTPPPDPEMMLKQAEYQRDTAIKGKELELATQEQHRKEVETGIKARQIDSKATTDNRKINADVMLATATLAQKSSEGDKDRNATANKDKGK